MNIDEINRENPNDNIIGKIKCIIIGEINTKRKVLMIPEKLNLLKKLVEQGRTTKEIAELLDISISSARSYIKKLNEGYKIILMPQVKRTNPEAERVSRLIAEISARDNSLTLRGIKNKP